MRTLRKKASFPEFPVLAPLSPLRNRWKNLTATRDRATITPIKSYKRRDIDREQEANEEVSARVCARDIESNACAAYYAV